ncbi:MAG: YfhO family protein, partial [Liquorilactobacillus satsumensis]
MQNVGIRKKSSKSTYVLAALIPPLLVILVWATKGIFPFGNNNLLVSDLGTQYVPFLTEMRRQLLSGQLSIYSFSLGLGDNFFPVAAYYLISPFNLVSLLFRPEQMPVAVELIILLKISAMGLT